MIKLVWKRLKKRTRTTPFIGRTFVPFPCPSKAIGTGGGTQTPYAMLSRIQMLNFCIVVFWISKGESKKGLMGKLRLSQTRKLDKRVFMFGLENAGKTAIFKKLLQINTNANSSGSSSPATVRRVPSNEKQQEEPPPLPRQPCQSSHMVLSEFAPQSG